MKILADTWILKMAMGIKQFHFVLEMVLKEV
jgi:hypothetical protein